LPEVRSTAGGAAAGGGLNFQAAVTAIAGVHLLAGQALGWLEGLTDDTPRAVWAESEGPGDDIRLELRDGAVVEVQVKKGLSTGERLWAPLLGLAEAVQADNIAFGVLVVCPISSAKIRRDLSRDIVRLGEGRSDGLKDLGTTFKQKLEAEGLSPSAVCARLRIQTVHALDADQADVSAARAHLAQVCRVQTEVAKAWSRLLLNAHAIIERRGRWDILGAARLLTADGITLAKGGSPAAAFDGLLRWTLECNGTFTLSGARTPLSIETHWLPLKAEVLGSNESFARLAPADALDRYHGRVRDTRRTRDEAVDAEWTGRFYRHAVVVGGPGLGKSTLLRKMAFLYAEDGHPVLRVRLRDVAARMQQGASFSESLLALGLDGSGVASATLDFSQPTEWVLLCDGLDETQAHQEMVAEALEAFHRGHPRIRIVVTTRPIGYETARLSQWRHYELLPLEDSATSAHLASLLAGLNGEETDDPHFKEASRALEACGATDVVHRGPHLLGMAAVLLANGRDLGETRTQLYQRLYDLLEQAPNTRKDASVVGRPVLAHAAGLMAWQVVEDPLRPLGDLLDRCARQMAEAAGLGGLRAAEVMDQCLGHWEDVGLVERVRHSGQDYLTFTHLTFAEYAAARWLARLPAAEQRAKVAEIMKEPKWAEVLAFAGPQGAATTVAAVFLEEGQGDAELLARILAVLAEPDSDVDEAVLERVLDQAWRVVDGLDDRPALKLGASLAVLAERYPACLASPAGARMASDQHWTRLIGLLCAMKAGVELDLAETVAGIEQLADELVRWLYPVSHLGGGVLHLGRQSPALLEQLSLCWLDRALKYWEGEKVAQALHRSMSDRPFTSFGFYSAARRRLGSAMIIPEAMRKMQDTNDRLLALGSATKLQEVQEIALKALLTACPGTGYGRVSKSLIRLSGFFQQVGVCSAPSDIHAWTASADVEAVSEVLRLVIEASPLEGLALAEEAKKAQELIAADAATDTFSLTFFACDREVDIPGPPSVTACLPHLDGWRLVSTVQGNASNVEADAYDCS